jgi:F-type H+-transporting ATPase subunit delta
MREAIIKTARNMSDETYDMLCKGVAEKFGSDIQFERVFDETLIGGFVLKLDGIVYDYSVRTQLKNLKKHISD